MTQKEPSPTYIEGPAKDPHTRYPHQTCSNSNRTASGYKTAKKQNNILNQHLHLEHLYTVENPTKLANDLTKITLKHSYRLITLGVKDLYVNIPIQEALQTTRTQLHKHNDKNLHRPNLHSPTSDAKPELCHLPNSDLPTHQRSSHGLPHLRTHRRNIPAITRTHSHQIPTRHKTLHKLHRRHPHNLRHSPHQPRYHHTLRQHHKQQPRTLPHSRTKQQIQLP